MKANYGPAITFSVVLHLALIVALLFGDFSHQMPTPKPVSAPAKPIEAVVLDKSKVQAHINKIRRDEQERARQLKKLEDRASAAKQQRAKEERRLKKLEQQRKQKELEKRKADAAAKKAKAKAVAAEKARKKQELAKKQADVAAKKAQKAAEAAKQKRLQEEAAEQKARELRAQREQERKRKAQEAKERAEQQKALEEQMAQEMAARQQAKRQQVQSEVDRYRTLILDAIQSRLITDQSTMTGKSCQIDIKLATSGFVIDVQARKGDAVVCSAAKNAVLKAGTLPMSKDPEAINELRNIRLTVAPEF